MFVKQISQPSFVWIKQGPGKFRVHVPRGIPQSFMITLDPKEIESLANHNYVMQTDSAESLKCVFNWGFHSVMKLTKNQIVEIVHGK